MTIRKNTLRAVIIATTILAQSAILDNAKAAVIGESNSCQSYNFIGYQIVAGNEGGSGQPQIINEVAAQAFQMVATSGGNACEGTAWCDYKQVPLDKPEYTTWGNPASTVSGLQNPSIQVIQTLAIVSTQESLYGTNCLEPTGVLDPS
jgi:hypothetical protein